jgi:phycocyanin beta chain
MQGVLEIIQKAEAEQVFVSSQVLQELQSWVHQGIVRVELVRLLSTRGEFVVALAATALQQENLSDLAQDSLGFEPQVVKYVQACQVILRYITYALLAGSSAVLGRIRLKELRENPSLEMSADLLVRAVTLMKVAAISLVGENMPDSEAVAELETYFDQAVNHLKDQDPQPLWIRLVEMGQQIPETEWAKLPTDLSRNFEHYLHGAPKEV